MFQSPFSHTNHKLSREAPLSPTSDLDFSIYRSNNRIVSRINQRRIFQILYKLLQFQNALPLYFLLKATRPNNFHPLDIRENGQIHNNDPVRMQLIEYRFRRCFQIHPCAIIPW